MIKNYLFLMSLCTVFFACQTQASREENSAEGKIESKERNVEVVEESLVNMEEYFVIQKLTQSQVTSAISMKGEVYKNAYHWIDKNGENLLVFSEKPTRSYPATFLDGGYEETVEVWESSIYVQLYNKTKEKWIESWSMQDYINDCDNEYFYLDFLEKDPSITDLNNDGLAEVWLAYKVACHWHWDSEQNNMKVLMYENGKKYASRGVSKQHRYNLEFDGFVDAKYNFDEAFESTHNLIQEKLHEIWQTLGIEEVDLSAG